MSEKKAKVKRLLAAAAQNTNRRRRPIDIFAASEDAVEFGYDQRFEDESGYDEDGVHHMSSIDTYNESYYGVFDEF